MPKPEDWLKRPNHEEFFIPIPHDKYQMRVRVRFTKTTLGNSKKKSVNDYYRINAPMTETIPYNKFVLKYMDLMEGFMNYLTIHRSDISFPDQSTIVFFDAKDRKFSDYSLRVLKKEISQKNRDVVEVTKTWSKTMPWRVSVAVQG